ncbi:MAG: hypothetical protein ACJ8ER_03545 [Allosphingosinicella sp.]
MAKETILSRPARIADPRLVGIFLDSRIRRLLLAFTDRPLSVAAAARLVGEPIGRVHYHVTSLARKGLLRVVREEKRAGRPVKYYRAVAESFLVPLDLLDRSPGTGLAAELRAGLDDALLRSEEDGILFFTESGEPRVSWFGQAGATGAAGEFWQIVGLAEPDVAALGAELRALMLRYEKRSSPGGRSYLIHAAFAPRIRR